MGSLSISVEHYTPLLLPSPDQLPLGLMHGPDALLQGVDQAGQIPRVVDLILDHRHRDLCQALVLEEDGQQVPTHLLDGVVRREVHVHWHHMLS